MFFLNMLDSSVFSHEILETAHTVPVRFDHQVQHVPDVLSMGNDSPHMYRVKTIENEMKPREILEKSQNGGILGLKKSLPSGKLYLDFIVDWFIDFSRWADARR